MPPNAPGSPSDLLPVPHIGAADGAVHPTSGPSPQGQIHGIWAQRFLARVLARKSVRPAALVGGSLLTLGLYFLQTSQGWSIGLPSIPIWTVLAVLGAVVTCVVVDVLTTLGSAVVDGLSRFVKILGFVLNSLAVPSLLRWLRLWLLHRLGFISRKPYLELSYGMVYDVLYSYLSPENRSRTRAEFVRDEVRLKMNPPENHTGRKRPSLWPWSQGKSSDSDSEAGPPKSHTNPPGS